MLFNEPKLLKFAKYRLDERALVPFSALQRAEIAEILKRGNVHQRKHCAFSALQRAEIAEIRTRIGRLLLWIELSVLFNEPKLLKFGRQGSKMRFLTAFSALQRAEIAEIGRSHLDGDDS